MINLIKLDIKNIFSKVEFYIAFTISLFVSLYSLIVISLDIKEESFENIFAANQLSLLINESGRLIVGIFLLIMLPLISTISHGDSHYIDKKSGIYNILIARASKFKYIISKAVTIFISGFVVLFIPFIIHQLLCFIIGPVYSFNDINGWAIYETKSLYQYIIWGKNFSNYPYLYNLIYFTIIAYIGAALSLIPLVVSYYSEKRVMILLSSTVIYTVTGLIFSLLNFDKWSFAYYVDPIKEQDFGDFLLINIILYTCILLSLLYKNFMAKDDIY